MALQLAAVRGARVIGTAAARNHDRLRRLGAEPVSYGKGPTDRVMALVADRNRIASIAAFARRW